jgi:uncharacterized MAPEG superfamily protein
MIPAERMPMTFAYWCVLITILLPLVWAGVSKGGGSGFDNARPRVYLAALQGWRQRANWAQQNAWEALAPFAAAVIIAHNTGLPQSRIDLLAGIFIVARILHGVFYIADQSTLRSLVWVSGFLCVVLLFVSGA